MKHKYRRVVTVEAEQFDGSDEMIKKYKMRPYGQDTWRLSTDWNFIPITKGCYIITDEDGLNEVCYPDIFERTYERVD